MARRQYTRVPDWLFPCLPELTGDELKALLVVIRQTAGWDKQSDRISYRQFALRVGTSKRHAIRVVKSLLLKGFLKRSKAKRGFNYEVFYPD